MRTVRVVVTGRVQGVGFRAWTKGEAWSLALRGWVRNRPDGSVEAVLSGPQGAVAGMLDRMAVGPRMARVDAVRTEEAPPFEGWDFEIRR